MSEFEEFLNKFEKYLNKKGWSFEKYKVRESFVYDIEKNTVALIEQGEEFSKNHIICRELLNLKNEKEYLYTNIKIKPFFSNSIKEWVTFYPFNGKITEELKKINEEEPMLNLLDRYEKWEGYRVEYAVFQLEDNGRKGYAIVKVNSIGSIVDLRRIAKNLLDAYIDYIVKNESNINEEKKIIKSKNEYEFLMDSTMTQILNERYITKYPIEKLKKLKEIADLNGFWTSNFQKDKEEIPEDLFKKLEEGECNFPYNIYTDYMKNRIPCIEDFDKEFYYVSVVYADDLDSYDFYNYLSDDKTIKPGDIVLVNRAGEDVIALVTEAKYYKGSEVPFPVRNTKTIIKKIENEKEIEEYGYTANDFEGYEFYYNEDDNDCYLYYIVTTLCDNKEIADEISKTLMEKRLVAGSQIYNVRSDYWWNGKIESKEEYKLEFRTRSDKTNEIVKVIKSIHDYQVPAISATRIECLTAEMKKWIDESVEKIKL